eukprot:CAMPEP_0197554746 /NCGR_PEP_ID=MMETSP1320-20131121/11938_1 /TAXON_ID=91990 /ORGANISM="Bolidomonas sp., Strain RCC2347" /LENGTH=363 /DNA_ID=CAMNT_0043115665 /DNA_START=178 /DNA_END=1266 /DNA_ORIENTATION=-
MPLPTKKKSKNHYFYWREIEGLALAREKLGPDASGKAILKESALCWGKKSDEEKAEWKKKALESDPITSRGSGKAARPSAAATGVQAPDTDIDPLPNTDPSPDSDSDSESDSDLDEAMISAVNIAAKAIKDKFASLSSKSKSKSTAKQNPGNELTSLIPGYTAPMKLVSSANDPANLYIDYERFKPGKKNKKNKKKEEMSRPAATVDVLSADPKSAAGVPTARSTSVGSSHIMKSTIKRKVEKTDAGRDWFNMTSVLAAPANSYQASVNAEALKKDQQVIRMRNFLDPKKFYKSADTPSNFAQRGTVIESGAEYFSSRLTKAERRTTLLDEVMSDSATRKYTKRKFGEIQTKKESGGKRWKKS